MGLIFKDKTFFFFISFFQHKQKHVYMKVTQVNYFLKFKLTKPFAILSQYDLGEPIVSNPEHL